MKNIEIKCCVTTEYYDYGTEFKISFHPNVIEALFSKEDVVRLFDSYKSGSRPNVDQKIFDGIFEVIKVNLPRVKTLLMDFEMFEFRGFELLWNCRYYPEDKSIYADIEYCSTNRIPSRAAMN